jgi:outer membrane receptor protein involved in Fe transport
MVGYFFPKLFGPADQLSISSQVTYTNGAYTFDRVKQIYETTINGNFSNFNENGLRYYKVQNPSKTMINLNFDYNVLQQLRVFMQLSNLTNNTDPDYTNAFSITGRGWMFGLKYSFSRTNP